MIISTGVSTQNFHKCTACHLLLHQFAAYAASTSSISWQYSTQQQLLGTAKISAANLLEGDVQHEHLISEGTAEFMPEPSLYDTATGTLMLLKEAKAKLQPVGSCKYKLVLHHEKDCSVE